MSLFHYAVDPATGFVPSAPPLQRLPHDYATWDALVPELSTLLRSRRVRHALRTLPALDVRVLQTLPERERALLLLFVENARTQVQFLGGVDEDWFSIASMGVELAGAPVLALVAVADAASRDGSDDELARILEGFAVGMSRVHDALRRIREWCDPATYFLRVRPFLSGWPDPGVVYEGVSETPRKFLGGSAAQSSLMQSVDALLGLSHADAPAGMYLRAIRAYMPARHRAFVEDIERTSRVRERAGLGAKALRDAYNAALQAMEVFRGIHMQLAHDFIIQPSGATHDPQGTGGTALTSFLRGAQTTVTNAKL